MAISLDSLALVEVKLMDKANPAQLELVAKIGARAEHGNNKNLYGSFSSKWGEVG